MQQTKNGDKRVIPITEEIIQVLKECPTCGEAPEEFIFKSRRLMPTKHEIMVEHSIARAEQSLASKDQLSPAILLHDIIVNLHFAVSAVAAFGNDPLFEGWVEIGIAKIDPKGMAPKFPKNSKGLIPVKNQWALAEQIGHGVDCWQVSPLSTGPNGKQSTPPAVYLLYGCFEKFIFPSLSIQYLRFQKIFVNGEKKGIRIRQLC